MAYTTKIIWERSATSAPNVSLSGHLLEHGVVLKKENEYSEESVEAGILRTKLKAFNPKSRSWTPPIALIEDDAGNIVWADYKPTSDAVKTASEILVGFRAVR